MTFSNQSYARHAEGFAVDLVDPVRIEISNSWFDETTADHWRHIRQYECVDCVPKDDSTWLTVGDGRWGLDSIRIKKKGFQNVLPTDISDALLKAAKQRGLISDYAVENAEKLTFCDQQFDYVFCKESLHHFPRPFLALYEMLRVARRAVFLIEPNDNMISAPSIALSKPLARGFLKALLRRATRKRGFVRLPQYRPSELAHWEDIGNYVYSFSQYEAEKIALALNLPQIAVKGFNDHFIEGCHAEPADASRSKIFAEIVNRIAELDRLCEQGISSPTNIAVVFFITAMEPQTRRNFTDRGWSVIDMPRNPYITD